MQVALYARISTKNKGQDITLQLDELRAVAAARGWVIAGEYVDEGVSGSQSSRPELNRLMADARRRKFAAVLVWKLDRFGRSLSHLVAAIAELEGCGVAFVSQRDAIDLSTPAGRLCFHMLAAMAEFERDLIRERVAAGIAHRKAKGLRVGRRPVDVTAAQLDQAIAEHGSLRKAAKALKIGASTAVDIRQRAENPSQSTTLTH